MESVQILAQINSEENRPYNWLVFPLIRQQVLIGILGWIFGAIVGGLFFAFMAPIMIPHNYLAGVGSAVLSTIILGMVLYVCLGSIWALITDILRLRKAHRHVIIITPDDFVKQEGEKVIHVPLEYIRHVTVRGTPPVDRSVETARREARPPSVGENFSALFLGRRSSASGQKNPGRRRIRTPTTLAFVDSRTDREVVVLSDKSFGDPHYIGGQLKEYVASKAQNTIPS